MAAPRTLEGRRSATPRVPVLICGEPWRGDDGSPRRAVRLLSARVQRAADLRLVGQLDPEHLLGVRPERPCVVVDAVVGIPAGQVVVLELDELGGPAGAGMRSTHLLPPAETIALAGALGADLRGSRLVGIGGADFTFGADLSPAVEAGLPRLVRALGRTILELAAHRPVEAATLAVLVPGPAFVNPPQTTDPRKESQP